MADANQSLSLLAFKPAPEDSQGGWYLTSVVGEPGNVLGWLSAKELRKPARIDGDATAGAILVLPELHASGLKPKVSVSFPLLRTRRDDAETVAKLRAGSTVTLLATEGTWYLVQSETGLLGWARANTLTEGLAAMKKALIPDTRAQLATLQRQLHASMRASAGGSEPWQPSATGLILENEYASTMDTYNLCPDGRVTLEFLVDDFKKYGTWTFDGDTLKLAFTRETKQLGVGAFIDPPEGQEGVRLYQKTEPYEGKLAEAREFSWSEILEDVKGDSPSFTPRRGVPTCQ